MRKSVLHRRIQEEALRRHSNAIKPHITEENKLARIRFCLSMLEERNLANNPTISCARSVVARPCFDTYGNVLFDGKIGVFPFIYKEPAKRNSKNRVAGTLVTKPILSITQDVIRSCLIENVLPAIKEKWPHYSRNSTIYIQQDNARTHISPFDDKFCEAAQGDGFDIQLTCQPPNSPNLNVLDLGYFKAIQSLQYREAPKTIDELVAAVKKSFHELSPRSFISSSVLKLLILCS
ncbi:hypothetical protein LIER_02143 [Lithospermum erythrorhizon]|uniref:Transposase n=1 Tax=Lithospermum erythrorhizon TaxID=34254 RepID=A0AAV3NPH5_LITER